MWKRCLTMLTGCGLMVAMHGGAEAAFVVKGTGDAQQIDATALAPHLQEGYRLFERYCTECHPQARTLERLQVYAAGQEEALHAELKVTLVKKLRMPGAALSTKEGKKILDFLMELHRLYDELKKNGK